MKRKYRERALAKLYQDVRGVDFDRRENALFQLTTVVKRSHPIERGGFLFDFELDGLSRDLRSLVLSKEELQQAAAELFKVIQLRPQARASAFRVLTYMQKEHAFEETVAFLRTADEGLDPTTARQICDAFHRWLDEEDASPVAGAAAEEMRARLEQWTSSTSERLAGKAEVVLRVLDEQEPAL